MGITIWFLILLIAGLGAWGFHQYRRQNLRIQELNASLLEARQKTHQQQATHAENKTKWEQTEEKLRSFLQLMDTLMNTIPNPIYFKDAEGIFQGCNQVFAKQILGLTRDHIIGKRPQELPDQIPVDLVATYQREEFKMIEKAGFHTFETKVQCADGLRRDFLYSLAPVMGRQGRLSGSVAILADLTEKNRAARNRMQKEKLEGVLETAGAVCHEFNQPLQVISGYTELIAMKLEGHDAHATSTNSPTKLNACVTLPINCRASPATKPKIMPATRKSSISTRHLKNSRGRSTQTPESKGRPMQSDRSTWITAIINDFVASSPENTLNAPTGEKAFDPPLVGFSSGSDPLYDEYVRHIGDFYLRPIDIFKRAFPEVSPVSPSALTVISWVLPSTPHTRSDQATETKRPSGRWVYVRHHGETLQRSAASACCCSAFPSRHPGSGPGVGAILEQIEPRTLRAMRQLVGTACGICGRAGHLRVVRRIYHPGRQSHADRFGGRAGVHRPSSRPYTDRHAYCLFYSHGTCGRCTARCPVNAISNAGHDKTKCKQYTNVTMNAFIRKTYEINTYACRPLPGRCPVHGPYP